MHSIGVFFGSRSPEHDVSIITGQLIISGLKKLGYKVVPIYIDRQGRWLIDERLGNIKFFTDPHAIPQLKDVHKFYLDLEESKEKELFKQKGLLAKKISIDIAFPAFHGQYGEDGTFQGMCEMFDIPYVGCDVTSSAITMDKVITKQLYLAGNIPTVPFLSIFNTDFEKDRIKILSAIQTKISFPAIIKPARLGSSIGISKAKNLKELEFGIEVAFHYDNKVIVEQCIQDLMDVTCCVIGNDEPIPSLLQESVFASDFFSYEDKYIKDGGSQTGKATQNIVIPARLDKKTTDEIRSTAVKVYKLLGCSGISRVDFLYDKKQKKYYANEVNTLPGTLYHHLWKASGVPFEELLKKLIEYALERHEKKKQLTHSFSSSILQKAGSTKLQLINK